MLLNVILRVLPFYIREPLVAAICLTLSGSCFYWTIKDGGWARFGFGVVFLGIAGLRLFILRGELRSRRAARSATQAPTVSPAADRG
ncbi:MULTISPECIES: hypothetical protein [unclassified Streptomyces]|uniref:hypothetical protein n=1 Tax=unclassified Streptomyces TaxID=2593676 RepID=UPI002E172AF9